MRFWHTHTHTLSRTGFGQGDLISIFYDPMISKLVVKGRDRQDALNRLETALCHYRIGGLGTNLDFLLQCKFFDVL
jgi:3-methylcrotonyl-CoA carboxylase alpha subunit